jgi:hypothetical protein
LKPKVNSGASLARLVGRRRFAAWSGWEEAGFEIIVPGSIKVGSNRGSTQKMFDFGVQIAQKSKPNLLLHF